MSNSKLNIIILAAGEGKRMRSKLPKTLHKIGGIPMLEHVVVAAHKLEPKAVYVVYGKNGDQVKDALKHLAVKWVLQAKQLGTGHAVQQAMPLISAQDRVLILYGDGPLVTSQLLENLVTTTPDGELGLVTAQLDNPHGFGRIKLNSEGKICRIVEHKDATAEELKIKEINTGIMIGPARQLKALLPKLKNANAQGEYYLTDVIGLAVAKGHGIYKVLAPNPETVLGVNDLCQLAAAERSYQQQKAQELMLQGVTLLDPNRFDLRGQLIADHDVVVDVNVIINGKVTIGANSSIGANCILSDCTIGANVKILPNSIVEGAILDDHCSIGPFARVRPKTHAKAYARIGNFVETKNTVIGKKSKANHLTYLGDATIGNDVNVGAGVITCNYDGINKFPTTIKDGAFIGSNVNLIAPLTIGKNAYIATGSTITESAPANKLTIARQRQTTIKKWQRPEKKK